MLCPVSERNARLPYSIVAVTLIIVGAPAVLIPVYSETPSTQCGVLFLAIVGRPPNA